MQLGIGGLEEKKIAEALFTSGADEEVDVFDGRVGVDGQREALTEGVFRAFVAGRAGDCIA